MCVRSVSSLQTPCDSNRERKCTCPSGLPEDRPTRLAVAHGHSDLAPCKSRSCPCPRSVQRSRGSTSRMKPWNDSSAVPMLERHTQRGSDALGVPDQNEGSHSGGGDVLAIPRHALAPYPRTRGSASTSGTLSSSREAGRPKTEGTHLHMAPLRRRPPHKTSRGVSPPTERPPLSSSR